MADLRKQGEELQDDITSYMAAKMTKQQFSKKWGSTTEDVVVDNFVTPFQTEYIELRGDEEALAQMGKKYGSKVSYFCMAFV